MKNMIEYKGYVGSVEFSEEDCVFYGKVLGIKSLVSYEGKTAESFLQDFHDAVDQYLEDSEANADEAVILFSVDVDGLEQYAQENGVQINDLSNEDLDKFIYDGDQEEKIAHSYSINNEQAVRDSKECGCFFCLKIFKSEEVKKWASDDKGMTALCPYCGIDSVLPDKSVHFDLNFLERMHNYWFE